MFFQGRGSLSNVHVYDNHVKISFFDQQNLVSPEGQPLQALPHFKFDLSPKEVFGGVGVSFLWQAENPEPRGVPADNPDAPEILPLLPFRVFGIGADFKL